MITMKYPSYVTSPNKQTSLNKPLSKLKLFEK